MMNKFRNWLYKFMYGRNGVDSICKMLIVPVFVILIINLFVTNQTVKGILSLLGFALIIYMYFRMFSKNIYKRRQENNWYESKVKYFKTRLSQSKDYRFYTCPNCKTHLRVPKGVGKITITCKKCGTKFDRKA